MISEMLPIKYYEPNMQVILIQSHNKLSNKVTAAGSTFLEPCTLWE